jgi:hypothetical protein
MPVSVTTTDGTFTYSTEVMLGRVVCGVARAVLRDAADWPPGEEGTPPGWRCTAGNGASWEWAISCTKGYAIVRAFGPVHELDPWVIAQVRLRIGLRAPNATAGLTLERLRLRGCGAGARPWLEADYRRGDGATLTIAEGRPYVCANLGLAPPLAVWSIDGNAARLVEFCAPTGCARLTGEYALDWRDDGLEVTLLTHGLDQHELLLIARSLRVAPA